MSAAAQLPPELAPWADAFAAFTPDVATVVGPLVRQLDRLFSDAAQAVSAQGASAGVEGVTGRGPIERVVISEWLLADELPLEFLRRAAEGELQYLAPPEPLRRGRGRVVLLVDTGPRQWGAGRLVQLAALIVLFRRAAAIGSELVIGVLGGQPGAWHTGDLADLAPAWLAARVTTCPEADAVAAWSGQLSDADEAWVLTGPQLAAGLPGRPRVVSVEESAWGDAGATAVAVHIGVARIELPLPAAAAAVRVLRGGAMRRDGGAAAVATALRCPSFPSADLRLIGRGGRDDELIVVSLPHGGRRRHRCPGRVIAASVLNRRVVALIDDGETLAVHVVGKALGRLAGVRIPVARVGPLPGTDELPPLFYKAGDLLVPLGGEWWLLGADGVRGRPKYAAVASGAQLDAPRSVWAVSPFLHGDGWQGRGTAAVLGPGRWAAYTAGGGLWQLIDDGRTGPEIAVAGDQVLGLVVVDDGPWLLTRSPGGLVLRLAGPTRTRTLTRWSGGVGRPAVHPRWPLLAVTRPGGRIEVADLERDRLVVSVDGVA